MTREEKDECLRKLQYIVDRANWGTIDRDDNGLPLGIRYASDVATAIENDNQTDLLKEFVEWLYEKNCIYSFLDGCYLVYDGTSLLNEFLEERKCQ